MGKTLRLIQWRGGKGLIWRWVVENIPPGDIYVEPFGGGASVLLNKPKHPVEVYNDLNDNLVNLFRAVQDENRFEKLKRRLEWTLYSYSEFIRALEILKSDEDLDNRAWAFYVACNQSFSGGYSNKTTSGNWGRTFVHTKHGSKACSAWLSGIKNLDTIRSRFLSVTVDSRDALEVIRYWDSERTVFYIDPPYPDFTRKSGKQYDVEFSVEKHIELLNLLKSIKGNFILSSYKNDLYDSVLSEIGGLIIKTKHSFAYSAGKTRTSDLTGKGGLNRGAKRLEALYIKGGISHGT